MSNNVKKSITIIVGLVILAAAVYGCYSFFTRIRNGYIISGYNAALKQVNETAQKEGQVSITIDNKKSILVPQK